MKRRSLWWLSILVIGVSANALDAPESVAVAGGERIYTSDLATAINRVCAISGKSQRDLSDAEKRDASGKCLDDLIRDSLLKQRAKDTPVSTAELDAAMASFRAQFESEERMSAALERGGSSMEEMRAAVRDQLRERCWIEGNIRPDGVTTAEAQKVYAEHPEAFQLTERVRASHILILISADMSIQTVENKLRDAEAIAVRARAGESFAQLAAEVSDDPTAKENSGDLNYFSRDRMEPAFCAAAFAMNPGDISDPVRTKFGFHIIQITDRQPARMLSFNEARPRILARLRDDKRRAAVAGLLQSLRPENAGTMNLPSR